MLVIKMGTDVWNEIITAREKWVMKEAKNYKKRNLKISYLCMILLQI